MSNAAGGDPVKRLADLLGLTVGDLCRKTRERVDRLAAADPSADGWVTDPEADRFREAARLVVARYDDGRSPEERWSGWKAQAFGWFVRSLDPSLALDVLRPHASSWPPEEPFPLPDEFCAALLQGYAVQWPGSREAFACLAEGVWETADGWIWSKR